MNTLTVWCYDSARAAGAIVPRLEGLAAESGLGVDDAAVVTWPLGRRRPVTHTLGTLRGPGRLWAGFWGVLFGVIFLTPTAGHALGAASGAIDDGLADFGLGDRFVHSVRAEVAAGASALFVVSRDTVADGLERELDGPGVRVVRSALARPEADYLREALAEESVSIIE